MSGIRERFEETGSLQSLGEGRDFSSDSLLMVLRQSGEDVVRVSKAVGDLEGSSSFIKSIFLQSYAENLTRLQQQTNNLFNSKDYSFEGIFSQKKTWRKPSDPELDFSRTLAQPGLLPLGVRLDWNSNKYLENLQGLEINDSTWDRAVLRNLPVSERIKDKTPRPYSHILDKNDPEYENMLIEKGKEEPLGRKYYYRGEKGEKIVFKETKRENFQELVDPIQAGGIFKRNKIGEISAEEKEFLSTNFEGTIPFFFEIITPNPTEIHSIYFAAYLDTIGDSFQGQVEGTRYVGRAEEVFTYSGFKRNSNFSFLLPALSQNELLPLYHKLSLLAGTTAPTYGKTSFMQGTLVRVTIGEFFKDLPGYITSLNVSWDKNISWELNPKSEAILPHVLKVDVQFQPIHEQLVETGTPFYVDLEKGKGVYKLESGQKYKITYRN